MARVLAFLVALSSLWVQARATELDAKPIVRKDTCPLSISTLQSERTEDGWTLHATLKNESDTDVSIAEFLVFMFTADGRLRREERQFINSDDLPVPAHDTKQTATRRAADRGGRTRPARPRRSWHRRLRRVTPAEGSGRRDRTSRCHDREGRRKSVSDPDRSGREERRSDSSPCRLHDHR